MTPACVLRFRPDQTDPVDWALTDATGALEASGEAALVDMAARCAQRRVIALVPAEALLITRISVPTRNRRRLEQAVPYALEDQLASPLEDLHFCIGTPGADGACPVVVAEHRWMEAWTGALDAAGIDPVRLTPDALTLPLAEGGWCGVVDGPRFVLRTWPDTGLAGETDNLPILLDAALAETDGAGPPHLLLGGQPRPDPETLPLPAEYGDANPATWFTGNGPELRTGRWGREDAQGSPWRHWRLPAALLLAWVALDSAQLLVERNALQNELTAQDERVQTLFREAFPDAQRVVAVRERMERRLESLRGGAGAGDDPLAHLAAAGDHLRQASGVRLRGLQWRGDTLELDLTADSLQGLDALERAIRAEGHYHAELSQARSEGDSVEGRLRVRREGT